MAATSSRERASEVYGRGVTEGGCAVFEGMDVDDDEARAIDGGCGGNWPEVN